MRSTRWYYFLLPLVIFSIAACVSCTAFKPIELKKVESVKVLNSSGEGIDLEIEMLISNPNFLKFTITEGDLAINLNKVDLGNAVLMNKVSLPAHSELKQKFVVHVATSTALLGGFASLLSIFQNKNATIGMKGTIRAKALGISRSFPVDENTKIPFSL